MSKDLIRISLKAYDHKLLDKSAEKIIRTAKSTGAIISGPIPMPTKRELHNIQSQAYKCSRQNNTKACKKTRELADPLMDHPRLPFPCKDALWELLQVAKTDSENSFERRDAIDKPAEQLSKLCKSDKALEEQRKSFDRS